MSVVGIFSSTINNTNTKTCCYMKCKRTYKIHERTLNTISKFTQACVPNTNAHLYKTSCTHSPQQALGLYSTCWNARTLFSPHIIMFCGELHSTLSTLSLPVSVQCIVSTNNSKYYLQDWIYRKCISGNVCSDTYPL